MTTVASRTLHGLIITCAVLALCTACTKPTTQSDATLMNTGLDALYTRHDNAAAVVVFREVLERNPTHYGATYQLAVALDRAGKADEAGPLWEKVLTMADGYHDIDTIGVARARLDDSLMKTGLDALYTRHDPAAAAAAFRQVLAHTPTHYGATYQLAAALDAGGQPAEARPLWEKVLQMAQGFDDATTAATARARLQKPS